MANSVFANGREIACKAGSGKSICAFPDVCMTPPENPATPPGVPVPYPNTGMDSDTTSGSSSVKISGQEVMLKDKSYFKKSTGDEAGSAAKKGVVSSVNRGKVYFIAWSMDVKFEGENVVRHMDMTTHNHGSPPNTPPQIFAARMAMANIPGCEKQADKIKQVCGEKGEKFTCPDHKALKSAKKARDKLEEGSPERKAAQGKVDAAIDKMAADNKADDCRKRMRCLLSPYKPKKCCPGQTPHHLVEAGAFHDQGRGGMITKENVKVVRFVRSMFAETQIVEVGIGKGKVKSTPVEGARHYDEDKAPCICVEGESQHQGTHKLMHEAQGRLAGGAPEVRNPNPMMALQTEGGQPARMQRLDTAIASGTAAVQEVFKDAECEPDCVKAQLEDYHYNKAKMNPGLPIKAVDGSGKAMPATL